MRTGRGGKSGTRGMDRSSLVGGPGGVGELGEGAGAPEAFADLPERLRERVLQARRAGFPAAYEGLLEEYYRRLARGEAQADGDDR